VTAVSTVTNHLIFRLDHITGTSLKVKWQSYFSFSSMCATEATAKSGPFGRYCALGLALKWSLRLLGF